MASSASMLFFACLFILTVVNPTVAQLDTICLNKGNYTTNSTYETNLNRLLPSIYANNEIDYGFYNSSYGENSDKVYSIALCRADITPDVCRGCVKNATQDIKNLCPTQKEAIVWYDNCMLRYSNRSIFGKLELGPFFWMYNMNNVSKPREFNQAANSLLGNLTNLAASGDSHRKFATGNTTTASSQTIFALVQCTPDLTVEECTECLTIATYLLPQCCDGRQGGRVIGPSCHFRYEKDQFYNSIAADAPSPSIPSTSPVSAPPPMRADAPPPPIPSTSPVSAPPPMRGKGRHVFIAVITLVSVLCL